MFLTPLHETTTAQAPTLAQLLEYPELRFLVAITVVIGFLLPKLVDAFIKIFRAIRPPKQGFGASVVRDGATLFLGDAEDPNSSIK